MKKLGCALYRLLNLTKHLDFLAPLLMRVYLVPVLWYAGYNKFANFHATVSWFANPDWGLGLPLPTLMVILAAGAEIIGAVSLLFGVAVRWICIPLLITMIVAMLTVHWHNGWAVIAPQASEAAQRLHGFMGWLKEAFPKRHSYITAFGDPAILNNGIEFGATYFIMLLSLFFTGAGKYFSVDYWIVKKYSEDT